MGPDQPPSPPSTPPSGPSYLPQPANTDNPALQASRFGERLIDPSAASQGTSMCPEMLQGNCLPDPSNQSSIHHALHGSVPRGNGATATFMPYSNTFPELPNLGTLPQQIHGNTLPLPPLGTSENLYAWQPQTIYPFPATSFSLNDWQQSTSLPQNSLVPHPQSQQWTESALLDSLLLSSTSSGLPPEAETASLRRECVDRSEIQDTDLPPNADRGIELASPRPAEGETTVHARRDTLVILSFNMQTLSSGSATYDGLKIPNTPSVNKKESESGKKLLHLQIHVLGATTKVLYTELCPKCKDRVGDKDAFPDFRAKSNIVVPQKNGRLLVAFTLTCCSKHREPQDSEYCLKVVLNGGTAQNISPIEYELPYSFVVVPKLPPRTRNRAEDVDAEGAVVPPPSKLPRIGFGCGGRNTAPQGAGPSEHSSGDSRGLTNNIPSATSGPPATSLDIHRPASPVESPMPSCRYHHAVSVAGHQETADGLDLVIEKVIPKQGPTTGGPEICIWGSNFPTDQKSLYARFGDNFARAVLQKPDVLLCDLPPASVPGMVAVTLRRSPNRNAPVIGTSLCKFEYTTDFKEILPIIIRIQEDCTPEVAAALDVLHKEVKNRNLTRNGKRPLRGGEASHEGIENAIIQALAPLHNTLNFEEVISKTNDYKQTLAHFAVFFGYTSLLRRLMGWNIDLTIADVNGFTALHCAYKTGDRACVDLLLENGASETVLDALGRAPFHLMPKGFAELSDHDPDTVSDDQLGLEPKGDAPRKPASTGFRIELAPSQSPSRQEEWNFRILQDAKVFIKLLRANGSPATSDAPLAEVYWWPARSDGPVSLDRATTTLYGNDGYGRNRDVCLSNVLNSTIHTLRSNECNRLYRFTAHDFAQSPIPSTLQESFRKALQEAMDDARDDGPLDLDTIRAKASQTREHPSSPVRATTSEQNGEDEGHHWEPPPPPENLMIPGELVLCRHRRSEGFTGSYWPARVMKYIPPKHHNGQVKYEVHFFDREIAKVSRDHFFTCFEEGFSSCTVDLSKLHRWHQVNGADESLLNTRTPPGTRSPSPEPLVPLSDDAVPLTQCSGPDKPFTQLTPREQLACFTHILQLIILDKYEPTRGLNREWMAGGKSREAVQLRAGMKGDLTAREGSIVTAQVRRWALRDERWASEEEQNALKDMIPDEPVDVSRKPEDQKIVIREERSSLIAEMDTGLQIDTSSATTSVQRQRGSPEYESLSRIDRSGYLIDVLIPEAIVQLLLWRNGDRTKSSPGPLPNPQDEAELREKGIKMRDESEKQGAWIGAVVQAWKATRNDKEMQKPGRPTKAGKR